MKNYFKRREFAKSDTARIKGIVNIPSKEQYKLFEVLRDKVLNPTRECFGKPITITSGYRCPKLNYIVGGVSNSEHLAVNNSCACDIICSNLDETYHWIVNNLEFNQCLLEKLNGKEWIHISYSTKLNRNYSAILR